MASQTSNLHLTLPTGTENVSRQIINTNMSTIDAAVGAVPSGQNLQSQVTNLANESSSLKSAFINESKYTENLLHFVEDVPYNTTSSYYYKKASANLSTSKKYVLKVTFPAGATGRTIEAGTAANSDSMVDTLYDGNFEANVPVYIYNYTPSTTGIKYFRSSGNAEWTLDLYEIVSMDSVTGRLTTVENKASTNEVDISVLSDETNSMYKFNENLTHFVENVPYNSTSNYYYKKATSALSTSKKYILKITFGTNVTANTIQSATQASSDYIVDTLYQGDFKANEPVYVYNYTPSASGVQYFRSEENVSWTLTLYEIVQIDPVIIDGVIKALYDSQVINKVDEVSKATGQLIDINQTNNILNGYIKPNGTFAESDSFKSYLLECDPSTVYTISTNRSFDRGSIYTYENNPTLGGIGTSVVNNLQTFVSPLSFETGASTHYILVYFFNETVTTDESYIDVLKGIKIQEGNIATPGFLVESIIIDGNNIGTNGAKKYGLKWNNNNPDDLGTRCFDAEGLTATIGVGSVNGHSDFDSIYPWSEMKRCNIKANENGALVVTYEGESGFSLTGSNGDVFVKIPKFYYQRYTVGNDEYIVVSESGANPHPAFIEDGKELDEIFVSAFEGKITSGELFSIGGVIPTGNEVAQTFLDAAQARGTGYSLYDSRCVDVIWTLMAVEFGNRNTNRIIGYGVSDLEQASERMERDAIIQSATNTNTVRTIKWDASEKLHMPVGSNITICSVTQQTIIAQAKITGCVDGTDYTDWTFDGSAVTVDTSCFIGSAAMSTNFCESCPSRALSWHTGRANWISGSIYNNPIRYRWIENVLGNMWHLLPDVTFYNLQMYLCKNIKDYVFHKHTDEYKPVCAVFTEQDENGSKLDVTGNHWITKLENNPFAKGVDFGRTFSTEIISTQAFGGQYYLYTGLMCIANGGGFDHLYRCNMLTQRAWIRTSTQWFLYGARLIYKNT